MSTVCKRAREKFPVMLLHFTSWEYLRIWKVTRSIKIASSVPIFFWCSLLPGVKAKATLPHDAGSFEGLTWCILQPSQHMDVDNLFGRRSCTVFDLKDLPTLLHLFLCGFTQSKCNWNKCCRLASLIPVARVARQGVCMWLHFRHQGATGTKKVLHFCKPMLDMPVYFEPESTYLCTQCNRQYSLVNDDFCFVIEVADSVTIELLIEGESRHHCCSGWPLGGDDGLWTCLCSW